MGNILIGKGDKIYSVNWTWGSLDLCYRVRNKPLGFSSGNVMIEGNVNIYVPGYQNGARGYYTQKLLPENLYADDPRIGYPDPRQIDPSIPKTE